MEVQWSDLPGLPLFTIAKLLNTPSDFSSFRRICNSWRSASKAAHKHFFTTQPPWLCSVEYDRLHSVSDVGKSYVRTNFLDVGRRKKWAVGLSSGHLILADCNSLHRLFLVDPFTGVEAHCFPKAPYAFSRAVLTHDGNTLLAFNSTVIQYCRRHPAAEWGVYQLLPPTEEQTTTATAPGPIRNMAVFKDGVYALTVDGKLGTVDFRPDDGRPELTVDESAESLPFGRFQGTWLGQSGEDLVAITCSYKLIPPRSIDGFVVRRFEFSTGRWVKVESLGERALFVDMSWGVLSDVPARWGGEGNCVYFTDPMRNSVGVFHVKDGRMEELLGPVVAPPCAVAGGLLRSRWDLSVWIIPSHCC